MLGAASVLCCLCTVGSHAKWSRESIICVYIVYPLLCVHCASIQVPALLGCMKAHGAIFFSHPFSPCLSHVSTTSCRRDCPLHGCTPSKSYFVNHSEILFAAVEHRYMYPHSVPGPLLTIGLLPFGTVYCCSTCQAAGCGSLSFFSPFRTDHKQKNCFPLQEKIYRSKFTGLF